MSWTNFHTHCYYCDGAEAPEEYVREAINQGLSTLGFSCHAPLPFETDWTMKNENLQLYVNSIKSLKEQYSEKLLIKTGLEIDYIPDTTGPEKPVFKKLKLDYSIGSVHFIDRNKDGVYWTADSSVDEIQKGIEDSYNGNARKAVEHYYELIQEMADKGGFDIVGHLDLIKKNNAHGNFFDENDKWYRNIVMDTLSKISSAGLIVEINTGGISRNYINCTYPGVWILKECCKMKIPLMLNSDTHSPRNITAYFPEAVDMLKEIGISELFVLSSNGWVARSFNRNGLILT